MAEAHPILCSKCKKPGTADKSECSSCHGRVVRMCGACRQVVIEFSAKDTWLIIVDLGGEGRRETVSKARMFSMLPGAFDPLEAGLLPKNPQNLLNRRTRRGKTRRTRR